MSAVDQATLELLPDPTVVVGGDGVVLAVNALAARLAGFPASALTGRPAAEVLPLTDEAGQDWWACAAPLARDAFLTPRIPEVDLALLAADGRSRPVTLTASRVPGERGRTGLLVVGLRRAERRARMDAVRSELVSTVSHELRSPLTSVRGFTRTMLAKWDRFTDEQRQQMLRTIDEDAGRVTRLLTELLDVSRIDSGQLRLARQMVDVPAVVDRVLARFAVTEGDRTVVSEVPADLPQLYGDPDKLDQVFTNLVENAVRHGAGRITVSAVERPDVVEFAVADEGSGIPSASRGHVFTKFFRARNGHGAGTGLGLYICKGIVDAHGGRIWADGDRLAFELPRGGLELAGL